MPMPESLFFVVFAGFVAHFVYRHGNAGELAELLQQARKG
jgi:hypothetical protein